MKTLEISKDLCETFQRERSNKINVCNTYCTIQCKIQMIRLINTQELITVHPSIEVKYHNLYIYN